MPPCMFPLTKLGVTGDRGKNREEICRYQGAKALLLEGIRWLNGLLG